MLFRQQVDQLISSGVVEPFAPAFVPQLHEVVPNVAVSQLSFSIAFVDEKRLEVQFDGKAAEHVKCHEKCYVIGQLQAVRIGHHRIRGLHVALCDRVWLFRLALISSLARPPSRRRIGGGNLRLPRRHQMAALVRIASNL